MLRLASLSTPYLFVTASPESASKGNPTPSDLRVGRQLVHWVGRADGPHLGAEAAKLRQVLLQLAELHPAVDSPDPAEDHEDKALGAPQVGEAIGLAVRRREREVGGLSPTLTTPACAARSVGTCADAGLHAADASTNDPNTKAVLKNSRCMASPPSEIRAPGTDGAQPECATVRHQRRSQVGRNNASLTPLRKRRGLVVRAGCAGRRPRSLERLPRRREGQR